MHNFSSEIIATLARLRTLEITYHSKTPHIGSAFSVIDILAVIYSNYVDLDKLKIKAADRKRVILSKGHAALGFYAVMEQVGLLQSEKLRQYCLPNSHLLGHVTHSKNTFVELSTGSLGHGLPYGAGMAYGLKKNGLGGQEVIVVISDGECNEGTTWESALIARHNSLNNLKVIIDRNRLQSIKGTEETLILESLPEKWKSFGWLVTEIDGHSHDQISESLAITADKPLCIIANTIKGKGVSFMENNNSWHYKSPTKEEYDLAKLEIEMRSKLGNK